LPVFGQGKSVRVYGRQGFGKQNLWFTAYGFGKQKTAFMA
jgi:hypothetical protein